ncbi:MAG: hypothetical protein V1921_06395 [Candidatus Altiarchaeota archaeon]
MTGTKVIKLRLEGGADSNLPKLREGIATELCVLYEQLPYTLSFDVTNSNISKLTETLGFDRGQLESIDSSQLQCVYDALEDRFKGDGNFGHKCGILLTYLMSHSRHNEFKLKVNKPLSRLGAYFTEGKKLTVVGDVKDYVGYKMRGGEITVKGSAGAWLGYEMEQGSILLEKNADTWAGNQMKGGRLHVKGNSGEWTGERMEGGILQVDGDSGEETGNNMDGGVINVNGKIAGVGRIFEDSTGELRHRGVKIAP